MFFDEDDERILRGSKHKRFIPIRERIASFKNGLWPIQMTQTPRDMASAGMFYTGEADRTVCFYCGKGFVAWQLQDDPFEEHAKHFPNCFYLKNVKGEEFIRQIQNKKVTCPTVTSLCRKITRVPEKKKTSTENDNEEKGRQVTECCCVCTTNEKEILFVPCKHICTCFQCSVDMSECCICRKNIVSKVKIFLS